ncbi:MAG: hypothetical protein LAP40_21920 [Acidobacteriia bacterium]|nr:hypothetical protein [Terriglobia bacterium]
MDTTLRVFIEDLPESTPAAVRLRGWIYRLRILGKTAFVILRDCSGEAQCVAATESIRNLRLKVEDTVEVRGTVRAEPRAPDGYEIDIAEILVLQRAAHNLPFQSADEIQAVGLETLVQYRPLALRNPAVGDIFRVQAAIRATATSWRPKGSGWRTGSKHGCRPIP